MTVRASAARFVDAVRTDPPLALLVAIILTLPLEFTRPWFPTGVVDLSRLGMIVGIAWVAWRFVTDRASVQLPPRSVMLAVAFVIAVEVASMAIFRWPSAPKTVFALLAFVGFGLFAMQAAPDHRRLRIVFLALLVSGVLEGAVLIAEQVGNFYLYARPNLEYFGRRNGTFVDPNITARLLVIALLVGFALQSTSDATDRRRAWIAAGLAIIAAGVALTVSRTGWIVLGLGILAWPVLTRRLRPSVFGPAIVAIVFAGTLLLLPNAVRRASDSPIGDEPPAPAGSGAVTERTSTALDPVIDALPLDEARQYLARAGAAMFEDHPIVGVGLGGFQPNILGPYRLFVPEHDREAIISLQHMDVLRVAAEEGLVGLAAWLLLLLAIGALVARTVRATADRPILWAAAGGILVILIGSQTEGRFYLDPYLWLLVAFVAAFAILPRGEGFVSASGRRAAAKPVPSDA